LEFVASNLNLELAYEPLGSESTSPVVAPFEPKRSAIVSDKKTGLYVGVIGEYKNAVARKFKLPEYAAGYELDMDALLKLQSEARQGYFPLSRYPSVDRDISLQVSKNLAYEEVLTSLKGALEATQLRTDITP